MNFQLLVTDSAGHTSGKGSSDNVPNREGGVMKPFRWLLRTMAAIGVLVASLCMAGPATAAGGFLLYNVPGTYTWTAPTGVTSVDIYVRGGGGGGGAASLLLGGGGGGGGGAAMTSIAVTPGTTYTLVVGAGGSGGSSNGQSGADTTMIDSSSTVLITGDGGSGGQAAWNSGGGGTGGTPSSTNPNAILLNGSAGANGTLVAGGAGGSAGFTGLYPPGPLGTGGSGGGIGQAGASGSGGLTFFSWK